MRLGAVPDESHLELEPGALIQLGRALERFQPIIEFAPDGTILRANHCFAEFMGFTREELAGQHHRILCDPGFANAPAYADFWRVLRAGHPQDGEFRRVRRDGRDVWIRAIYAPLPDASGQVSRIIKLAMDITEAKRQAVAHAGLAAAVDGSLAVIEFDMSGQVLSANSNYLALLGYSAAEIIGRGHDIFCPPGLVGSPDYLAFWSRLRSGAFQRGTFQRVAKDGRPIWIEAAYNPVLGSDGLPSRIVKVAMDVTESHQATAGLLVDAKAEIMSAVMQMFNASTFAAGSADRTRS